MRRRSWNLKGSTFASCNGDGEEIEKLKCEEDLDAEPVAAAAAAAVGDGVEMLTATLLAEQGDVKVTGMDIHGYAHEAFRRVHPEAFRPGGGGEVGALIFAFLEGRCSLDELQEFIRGFPRTRFMRDLLRVCEDLSDGGGGGGGRQPEELPVGRGRRRRTRR